MDSTRFRITVFNNGQSVADGPGQVVVVNDETTIQLFLEAAQLKLGVPLAKRVFIEGGGEINNIMDLAQDDVCYISGGENYVSPAVEYGNAEEPGLGGYTSQTRFGADRSIFTIELVKERVTRKLFADATTTVEELVCSIIRKVQINEGDKEDYAIVSPSAGELDPGRLLFSYHLDSDEKLEFKRTKIPIILVLFEKGDGDREESVLLDPSATVQDTLQAILRTTWGSSFADSTYQLYLPNPGGFKKNGGLQLASNRTMASYRLSMRRGDKLVLARTQVTATFDGKLVTLFSTKHNVTKTMKLTPSEKVSSLMRRFLSRNPVTDGKENYGIFRRDIASKLPLDEECVIADLGMPAPWQLEFRKLPEEMAGTTLISAPPGSAYFGVPHSTLPRVTSHGFEVPVVLAKLRTALEKAEGLQQDGIFRLAGQETIIISLKEQINTGTAFKGTHNQHEVATLIKRWYRDLPTRLWSHLDEKVLLNTAALTCATAVMPPETHGMYLWLLDLLAECAQYENQMNTQNLSTCFATNLVGSAELDDNPFLAIEHTRFSVTLLECNLRCYIKSGPPVMAQPPPGPPPSPSHPEPPSTPFPTHADLDYRPRPPSIPPPSASVPGGPPSPSGPPPSAPPPSGPPPSGPPPPAGAPPSPLPPTTPPPTATPPSPTSPPPTSVAPKYTLNLPSSSPSPSAPDSSSRIKSPRPIAPPRRGNTALSPSAEKKSPPHRPSSSLKPNRAASPLGHASSNDSAPGAVASSSEVDPTPSEESIPISPRGRPLTPSSAYPSAPPSPDGHAVPPARPQPASRGAPSPHMSPRPAPASPRVGPISPRMSPRPAPSLKSGSGPISPRVASPSPRGGGASSPRMSPRSATPIKPPPGSPREASSLSSAGSTSTRPTSVPRSSASAVMSRKLAENRAASTPNFHRTEIHKASSNLTKSASGDEVEHARDLSDEHSKKQRQRQHREDDDDGDDEKPFSSNYRTVRAESAGVKALTLTRPKPPGRR